MRVELAGVPDGRPAPIRAFDPQRDEEDVHALVQDAFAEVPGNVIETREVWRATRIAMPGFDPSLWLLLEDDDGLAGVALGRRWESGVGYVDQLAVAGRARGRGYGRTLLVALLDAFRAAGLTAAELSVVGGNRSATRLYESVGMKTVWVAERWEKEIGAG
jgi:ribosomal protein S18 acetylase RimI-like enzyme